MGKDRLADLANNLVGPLSKDKLIGKVALEQRGDSPTLRHTRHDYQRLVLADVEVLNPANRADRVDGLEDRRLDRVELAADVFDEDLFEAGRRDRAGLLAQEVEALLNVGGFLLAEVGSDLQSLLDQRVLGVLDQFLGRARLALLSQVHSTQEVQE